MQRSHFFILMQARSGAALPSAPRFVRVEYYPISDFRQFDRWLGLSFDLLRILRNCAAIKPSSWLVNSEFKLGNLKRSIQSFFNLLYVCVSLTK